MIQYFIFSVYFINKGDIHQFFGYIRKTSLDQAEQKMMLKSLSLRGFSCLWVNYNDLTVLPHWKSWLVREIIPKWALIQVSEIL